MSTQPLTVALIGAGGKMGMRVSANLERSAYDVAYCEKDPTAQQRVSAAGRALSPSEESAARSDVVVLAVPDVALAEVSESLVPLMASGSLLLTLDPAAAYAGILKTREDVYTGVAHPCHPSVFLERTSPEQWSDTFGGVAAPQDAVAALEPYQGDVAQMMEGVVRAIYGPVLTVHWVTVRQLAVLEPTLVETVTCMFAGLLKEALGEAVRVGVPEPAARAMLLGHIQVALTNCLRGSNPFSEACLIAMDHGRRSVVREDWKTIFEDSELDKLIARMLHIDRVVRSAASGVAQAG